MPKSRVLTAGPHLAGLWSVACLSIIVTTKRRLGFLDFLNGPASADDQIVFGFRQWSFATAISQSKIQNDGDALRRVSP